MKLENMPKKIRSLAYQALERDSLNDIYGADDAFDDFLSGKMTLKTAKQWASRQVEWVSLND